MPRYLTLSKAARLLGINRSAIQKKIQAGELSVFDGEVELLELRRAYPDLTENPNMVENLKRLDLIKENALNKILTEADLPDAHTLSARVIALSRELSRAKAKAALYDKLAEQLQIKLTTIEFDSTTALADFRVWCLAQINQKAPELPAIENLLARDAVLRILAAHVKINATGHEFFVEGKESILEAGLRSGLSLNYGCSSGNCGLCRARIVSGEIKQIRAHDYSLSAAESNAGYCLMCSYTAITDIEIETAEAHSIEDIPAQTTSGKIRKIEKPNESMLILRLRLPRTKRLRFIAGQLARLEINGIESRPLPIASCPCDELNLEFHIPDLPKDSFQEYLYEHIAMNEIVRIRGPEGEFVLQEDSEQPHLFIAFGRSFAGLKSLVEHAIALNHAQSIRIVWFATEKHQHYLQNHCRAWTDALDNFVCDLPLYDSNDDLEDQLAAIATHLQGQPLTDIYVAGSHLEVDLCEKIFHKLAGSLFTLTL